MTQKLFEPKNRDRAVETTCSNLVMTGVLLPSEVGNYMSRLVGMNDLELAETLCYSRLLWDKHLEHDWNFN